MGVKSELPDNATRAKFSFASLVSSFTIEVSPWQSKFDELLYGRFKKCGMFELQV